MRKQAFPVTIYNVEDDEYELTIERYGNVLIEDGDEPGEVGLVVVYPDTRPIRYLVTEVDEKDDSFISRGTRFEIDQIDD
jgi:hypothetical protein